MPPHPGSGGLLIPGIVHSPMRPASSTLSLTAPPRLPALTIIHMLDAASDR